MRRIIAAIIFILVIVSFFYQYKYGTNQPSDPVISHDDLSEVTPKPVSEGEQLHNENITEPAEDMFKIHADDIVLGNPEAKVILIEYSSLTCPHCAYFHKDVYPELKKKYIDTNKITYVLRAFISNKQDLDGAILARCLEDKKDPLKLMNILYTQQDNWAFNKNYRELLENIGQLAGISKEKYATCLARSDWIQTMANNSRSVTFNKEFVGTPAFVINGNVHKGIYDEATISKAIDIALDATKEVLKGTDEKQK